MGKLTNNEIEVIRGLERFLQRGRKICSSKNGFPLWFQASLNLLRHALKVGRLEELREYRHDPLPSIPPQEETADWHQTLVDFSIETNSPDEGSDRLRITIRGYPNPETRSETTWPTKSTEQSAGAQQRIASELQKLPERIREVQAIIKPVEARGDTLFQSAAPETAPSIPPPSPSEVDTDKPDDHELCHGPVPPRPDSEPPESATPPGPPPQPGTNIDRIIEASAGLGAIRNRLQGCREEAGDLAEALGELEDWFTWLVDRAQSLRSLSQAEVIEKLRLWHRAFDYYLAADPGQSYPFSPEPDKPPAFTQAENRDKLVGLLKRQQAKVREVLALVAIERIEAAEGSPLVVGVIEKSQLATQPTDDDSLHGRVARVEPGEGGYRAGGRVFLVAQAICFEYVAPG
jgi:hypothetical protein